MKSTTPKSPRKPTQAKPAPVEQSVAGQIAQELRPLRSSLSGIERVLVDLTSQVQRHVFTDEPPKLTEEQRNALARAADRVMRLGSIPADHSTHPEQVGPTLTGERPWMGQNVRKWSVKPGEDGPIGSPLVPPPFTAPYTMADLMRKPFVEWSDADWVRANQIAGQADNARVTLDLIREQRWEEKQSEPCSGGNADNAKPVDCATGIAPAGQSIYQQSVPMAANEEIDQLNSKIRSMESASANQDALVGEQASEIESMRSDIQRLQALHDALRSEEGAVLPKFAGWVRARIIESQVFLKCQDARACTLSLVYRSEETGTRATPYAPNEGKDPSSIAIALAAKIAGAARDMKAERAVPGAF